MAAQGGRLGKVVPERRRLGVREQGGCPILAVPRQQLLLPCLEVSPLAVPFGPPGQLNLHPEEPGAVGTPWFSSQSDSARRGPWSAGPSVTARSRASTSRWM